MKRCMGAGKPGGKIHREYNRELLSSHVEGTAGDRHTGSWSGAARHYKERLEQGATDAAAVPDNLYLHRIRDYGL